MAKLTLSPVGSNNPSATTINANNVKITTALDNTLSRDGTAPNAMNTSLDMNNHRVINLPEPTSETDAFRMVDFELRKDELKGDKGDKGDRGNNGLDGTAARDQKKKEVWAHRGFAKLVPENTLTAFSFAAANGCKFLECDVQISSDGVPVVIHDTTLGRTTDGEGNVKDTTWSALSALDAGSYFATIFSSTRIPKFEDVLKFARANRCKVAAEIKGYRSAADIALMVGVAVDLDMVDQVTFCSFTLADLVVVREISPKSPLGYLRNSDIEGLSVFAALGGDLTMQVAFEVLLSNPLYVETCREVGVDVMSYTVNNTFDVEALANLGVTRVISDYLQTDY